MIDEPCRLTFIFFNVLYPQHRFAVTLAFLCQKTAYFDYGLFAVLPTGRILTDDFGGHFELHQTLLSVFLLPGFVHQHNV